MTYYEFALIRYVHNAASGECVNVGLAMLVSQERRLRVQFNTRYGRIGQFFQDSFDGNHYRNVVRNLTDKFDELSEAFRSEGGMFPTIQDLPENFRGLMSLVLPEDSTTFRLGPLCGGMIDDPDSRFDELFRQFVTRHERPIRQGRQESQIWSDFERTVRERSPGTTLRPRKLGNADYAYEFQGSYVNGTINVVEPISFDLLSGSSIVEKANGWVGRLVALRRGADFSFNAILAPPPEKKLRADFDRARRLLAAQDNLVKHLVIEGEEPGVLEQLLREIEETAHK